MRPITPACQALPCLPGLVEDERIQDTEVSRTRPGPPSSAGSSTGPDGLGAERRGPRKTKCQVGGTGGVGYGSVAQCLPSTWESLGSLHLSKEGLLGNHPDPIAAGTQAHFQVCVEMCVSVNRALSSCHRSQPRRCTRKPVPKSRSTGKWDKQFPRDIKCYLPPWTAAGPQGVISCSNCFLIP